MRLGFLLGFIPDEILLIVIMVVILGYVLGLLPSSFFLGAVLIFILLFTPLLDNLLEGLGFWWWVLIITAVGVAFVRGGLGLLLGQRVADGLISHLLRDLLVLPFRMVGGIIRMVCTFLRGHLLHRFGGRVV